MSEYQLLTWETIHKRLLWETTYKMFNQESNKTFKFFIDGDNLIPVPVKYNNDIIIGKKQDFNDLKVGQQYKLQEDNCEGNEMPYSIYECKHIIKEYGGINLNAVVMKQIQGNSDMIFSLTRIDCNNIGIEYEPKLQLFPINFNWRSINSPVEFNPLNMGTYPPSPLNGKHYQIHLIIKNVTSVQGGFNRIITPHGLNMSLDSFLQSLRFEFKDLSLRRKFPIVFKTLFTDEKQTTIFDTESNGIGIMLFFGNPNSEGIDSSSFEGKTINDILRVSCSVKSSDYYQNKDIKFNDSYWFHEEDCI